MWLNLGDWLDELYGGAYHRLEPLQEMLRDSENVVAVQFWQKSQKWQ